MLKFMDGPAAPNTIATDFFSWPLPARLAYGGEIPAGALIAPLVEGVEAPEGTVVVYRKVAESQWPESVDDIDGVMRGAAYEVET